MASRHSATHLPFPSMPSLSPEDRMLLSRAGVGAVLAQVAAGCSAQSQRAPGHLWGQTHGRRPGQRCVSCLRPESHQPWLWHLVFFPVPGCLGICPPPHSAKILCPLTSASPHHPAAAPAGVMCGLDLSSGVSSPCVNAGHRDAPVAAQAREDLGLVQGAQGCPCSLHRR